MRIFHENFSLGLLDFTVFIVLFWFWEEQSKSIS
jgi:hypothetical protein